jgi:hypothetical protein
VRVNVQAPSAPAPPTTPTPPPTTPRALARPGAGDELDLRQVTFLHRDISRWPVTSTITNVRITSGEICVDHTGAGRFPTSTFGTIQVEGNVWILAQFGGRWYAATYDWLRIGQTCKTMTARELGVDQIRIAPMDASWPGPRSGRDRGLHGQLAGARRRAGRRGTHQRRPRALAVTGMRSSMNCGGVRVTGSAPSHDQGHAQGQVVKNAHMRGKT